LSLDSIFACAEEGLDAQMLLDPLEEQLDLPSAFIKGANGDGRQGELVGEEDEILARIRVAEADAAQVAGIVPMAAVLVQSDSLIGNDAALFVDGAGVDTTCVEVALGASNRRRDGK
jgi:hypothetical protein